MLSGLRIWHCHELWCRLQVQLRSGVAAQICGCGVGRRLQLQLDPLAWEPPYASGVALEKAKSKKKILLVSLFIYLILFIFLLFRAVPTAYGGSQARGSNRSCSCQPTPEPQQRGIRAASVTHTTTHANPLSKGRGRTRNLMVPSWICYHCTTMGTPC